MKIPIFIGMTKLFQYTVLTVDSVGVLIHKHIRREEGFYPFLKKAHTQNPDCRDFFNKNTKK